MRMYEVIVFNSIYENKDSEDVNCYRRNYIAKESDLESLKEKGGGFVRLKYIGDLYTPEDESLSVIIKAEVEGLEEANALAKELQDTIDSTILSAYAIGEALQSVKLNLHL